MPSDDAVLRRDHGPGQRVPADRIPDATPADAFARRALGRAQEAARARGNYPVRKTTGGAWEVPSYEVAGGTGDGGAAAGAGAAPGSVPGGAPGGAPESTGWRPGPGMGDVLSGPGPSRRDPQPLGGVTARFLAEHGWSRPVSVGAVMGRWAEIVGPEVAEHCTVERFTDGDLVIRADSTAWATQMRLLLPQVERRLAEEVGPGAVTSIEVRGPGGPTWKHGKWSVTGGRGPRDTYG